MTTILVTGGTSGPGRPLVDRLRAAGHDVRVLSRSPGDGHLVGDLDAGTGLEAAVEGADVVVHLATNRSKDLGGTLHLLAAAKAAGVGHLVFLSIVGVDRIPYGYYRDKVANEQAIADSGVPFTILRATQFHSFPGDLLKMTGGRFFVDVPIQPIGVDEVAVRLAELATGAPASSSGDGRAADIGGPEILQGGDILARLQRAGRAKKRVFSISLPGRTFAAFKAGHQTSGLPGYGTQTFDEWLASGSNPMTLALRLGLAVLAIVDVVIGAWNAIAPEHFYANFPGVSLTPPFAEHYARDFGGTLLGLGIILSVAVVLPRAVLVIPALIGMAVFAIPHAYFHVEHLHDASPFETAFTLTAVLGQSVLTVALLVLAIVRWRHGRAHSEDARTAS